MHEVDTCYIQEVVIHDIIEVVIHARGLYML